jgi:large subunit ribosomal protein L5
MAMEQLTNITGSVRWCARAQSIAAFSCGRHAGRRQGDLRRTMYEFLDRLISIGLPRVRDFRGVSRSSFDGRGSYTLGIRDILIFPEVDYQKVEGTIGMNITITTSAPTDDQAQALLAGLGMPFTRS